MFDQLFYLSCFYDFFDKKPSREIEVSVSSEIGGRGGGGGGGEAGAGLDAGR